MPFQFCFANKRIHMISILKQFICKYIGDLVSKETVCCFGGKVKH